MNDKPERRFNPQRTGIENLRRQIELKTEPMGLAKTLGFRLIEANVGFVAFIGEPTEAHINPQRIAHGGWGLALLDTICGSASHTMLGPGEHLVTLETKGNFVRPFILDNGPMRAEGRSLSHGRTIFTAEGKIFDASGKLLLHGTSTLMLAKRQAPAGENLK